MCKSSCLTKIQIFGFLDFGLDNEINYCLKWFFAQTMHIQLQLLLNQKMLKDTLFSEQAYVSDDIEDLVVAALI